MIRIPVFATLFLAPAWQCPFASATAFANDGAGSNRAVRLLESWFGTVPDAVCGFEVRGAIAGDEIHFIFRRGDAEGRGSEVTKIVLSRRDDSKPAFARTRSYNVAYMGPTRDGKPEGGYACLTREVLSALSRNDIENGPWIRHVLTDAAGVLAIALAISFVVLLPWIVRWLLREPGTWSPRAPPGRERRFSATWVVTAAFVLGLVARLLMPHNIGRFFEAYRLATDAAVLGGFDRHGTAFLALLHVVFEFTGTSHAAVIVVNSLAGALLVPTAAAVAYRLGASRLAATACAVLVAIHPAMLSESASASTWLPASLWTLLALWQFSRFLDGCRTADLLLFLLSGSLAAATRPETGMVVVPGMLIVVFRAARAGAKSRVLHVALVTAALAMLLIPAARFLIDPLSPQRPSFDPGPLDIAAFTEALTISGGRTAGWPAFFPPWVLILSAAALVLSERRRPVVLAVVACALSLIPPMIGLPAYSPSSGVVLAGTFAVMASALGIDAYIDTTGRLWSRGHVAPLVYVLGAALLVWSVLGNGKPIATGLDSALEESLISRVLETKPEGPAVLVRREASDWPVEDVPLPFPDYEFESAGWTIKGIRDLTDNIVNRGNAYFLLDVRCYYRTCPADQGMHFACNDVFLYNELERVFEDRFRLTPKRYGRWCVADNSQTILGLYRIKGRKTGPVEIPEDETSQ